MLVLPFTNDYVITVAGMSMGVVIGISNNLKSNLNEISKQKPHHMHDGIFTNEKYG